MLTQLRLAGVLERTAALVFNSLPRCDEPGGVATARDAVRRVLADPGLRAQLVARSEVTLARHDPARMARAVLGIYASVTSQGDD